MISPLIRRVGLLGASAALVAACAGGGGATTPPATIAATAVPTTAAATQTATRAPSGLTLALATNATLGAYVTGANGLALYIFTNDTGTTSACTGTCAENWPPLTVAAAGDVTAGAGVTGALGTITRDDGKLQVTLAGHPLYYFKNDAGAGDVNGQGINDVWFLAGADGTGLGMAAGEATPAASKGCSGPACY